MPDQHNRHGQRAHREKAGGVDNPKENQETQKVEKKPRRKAYITNQVFRWITLTVDVLVFFAVAIYSFFAYQQWRYMGVQLTLQAAQLNQASTAQVASELNAHLEQRAWVSTFQVPKSDIPQEGSRWRVEIPIKNTGKTFARKMGLDATVFIIGADGRPNFTTRDPRSDPPVKDLLLSPNGEYAFAFHTKGPISHEEIERIKSGGNAILHGYITYYDIFDCVHWTIFCFWLDPEDWKWKVYQEHNDADNDRCE